MASARKPRPIRLAAAAGGLLVLAACAVPPAPADRTTLPCAPAQQVDLGAAPLGDDGGLPVLEVSGGTVWVRPDGFIHGGLFDPKEGVTRLSLGPADQPPTYDPGPATLSHTSLQIQAHEGYWTPSTLPPGRYWVASSNGARLQVAACDPGQITDSRPAPQRAPVPSATTS